MSDHEETQESQVNPEVDALTKRVQELELKLRNETEEHSFTTSELASLKDQVIYLNAAKEAIASELREEKRKREAAEETVELLRGKVEEARRGVMTLQKQEKDRRRVSAIPAGAEGLGLGALGEQGSSRIDLAEPRNPKRQSTIGIGPAARGHRRISSHSEPGFEAVANLGNNSPPQRAGGLRQLKLGTGGGGMGGPSSPTLVSQPMFGRSLSAQNEPIDESPSPSVPLKDLTPTPATDDDSAQLRQSIAMLEHRLAESEEARESSELCLKALRDFIASGANNAGTVDLTNDDPSHVSMQGLKLPPLPTDRDAEASFELEPKKPKSGWGLRLWKDAPIASPALSTTVEPPMTPQPIALDPPVDTDKTLPLPPSATASATPLASFVASWTKGVSPGSPPVPSPNPNGRSFSFFGKKAQPTEEPQSEAEVPVEVLENAEQADERQDDIAEEVEVEHVPSEEVKEGVIFEDVAVAGEEGVTGTEPVRCTSDETDKLAEAAVEETKATPLGRAA